MLSNENIFFSLFLLFIAFMLSLDLGVISRKSHIVSFKEAAIWSGVWVILALSFYFFVFHYGHMVHGIENFDDLKRVAAKFTDTNLIIDGNYEQSLLNYRKNMALEYLTGYLIEYSLSVDNIFVIMIIFTSFGVPEKLYKKVLFWGILGAVIMRFAFIFLGSALVQQFDWIFYLFGAFLIFSGIKIFVNRNEDESIDPSKHIAVRTLSRFFKVSTSFEGEKFFTKIDRVIHITPLFVVLVIIELTDLVFAIDSVPAIFAITKDPYIVFFSNIFAIMGLRSMFFFLANIMGYFRFLKVGLSVLLVFIGFKMIFHHYMKHIGFKTEHSLYIILTILGLSILMSVLFPEKKHLAK